MSGGAWLSLATFVAVVAVVAVLFLLLLYSPRLLRSLRMKYLAVRRGCKFAAPSIIQTLRLSAHPSYGQANIITVVVGSKRYQIFDMLSGSKIVVPGPPGSGQLPFGDRRTILETPDNESHILRPGVFGYASLHTLNALIAKLQKGQVYDELTVREPETVSTTPLFPIYLLLLLLAALILWAS